MGLHNYYFFVLIAGLCPPNDMPLASTVSGDSAPKSGMVDMEFYAVMVSDFNSNQGCMKS